MTDFRNILSSIYTKAINDRMRSVDWSDPSVASLAKKKGALHVIGSHDLHSAMLKMMDAAGHPENGSLWGNRGLPMRSNLTPPSQICYRTK